MLHQVLLVREPLDPFLLPHGLHAFGDGIGHGNQPSPLHLPNRPDVIPRNYAAADDAKSDTCFAHLDFLLADSFYDPAGGFAWQGTTIGRILHEACPVVVVLFTLYCLIVLLGSPWLARLGWRIMGWGVQFTRWRDPNFVPAKAPQILLTDMVQQS